MRHAGTALDIIPILLVVSSQYKSSDTSATAGAVPTRPFPALCGFRVSQSRSELFGNLYLEAMSDLALAAAFAAGQQPAAEAYAPQRRAAAPVEPVEEEMSELPTIDDLEVAAAAAGVAPVPPLLAELGYFELGPTPDAMKEDSSSSEEESSSSDEGEGVYGMPATLWTGMPSVAAPALP